MKRKLRPLPSRDSTDADRLWVAHNGRRYRLAGLKRLAEALAATPPYRMSPKTGRK